MNTICPHLFIIKSLLKSLPAHFDIINRTHDRFRNRDFSAVANYHGYTKTVPLKNNLSYIEAKFMLPHIFIWLNQIFSSFIKMLTASTAPSPMNEAIPAKNV